MKKIITVLLAIVLLSMSAAFCVSAETEETPEAPTPHKADLLDLTFNADGTWSENAQHEKFAPELGFDNTAATIGETVVAHNGKYYKAHALLIDTYDEWFSIDFGKYATSSDTGVQNEFLGILNDGYTMSCTFQARHITPNVHKAIFSSTQQGGFGLYFTAGSDKASNPAWAKESGKMFFELSHKGSSAWSNLYSLNYVQNNGDLVAEVLYDVAVSYFADENKLVMYVNGVKTDEIDVTDELAMGNTTYNFGLGVDVGSAGILGDASHGGLSIVNAKLYTDPITEAEAKTAYDAVIASLGTAYDNAADVPVVTTQPTETTTTPADDTTTNPTDDTTADPSDDTTTLPTNDTTTSPVDTTTKIPSGTEAPAASDKTADDKGGCGSVLGAYSILGALLATLVSAAVVVKKRRF